MPLMELTEDRIINHNYRVEEDDYVKFHNIDQYIVSSTYFLIQRGVKVENLK